MTYIYMTLAGKRTYKVNSCKDKEAEQIIRLYEKQDRYEHEVEKYSMPRGWEGKYPEYFASKNPNLETAKIEVQ